MGRLVRKQKLDDLGIIGLEEDIFVHDSASNHVAKAEPGDGYLERVVKYVPAEIIAFSMIINAILDQAVKNGGPNALMAGLPVTIIAWAGLLVAMILTPIFCWYVQKDGDAWIANAVVSTLAFGSTGCHCTYRLTETAVSRRVIPSWPRAREPSGSGRQTPHASPTRSSRI